jgi:hypothetical protein
MTTSELPTTTHAIALIGASTAGPTLALTATAILLLPVVAATVVFAWHGIRGTDPGPAGQLLITLVRIVLGHRWTRR